MTSRIAIVTGANRGIGLAIGEHNAFISNLVRQLALQYPGSYIARGGGSLLIYLTSRDPASGKAAVQSLQQDGQLQQAKALASSGGQSSIEYEQLDIGQTASIRALVARLKERHPEGIDILINNAGIAMDGFDENVVEQTLQVNYYGTLEATQAFLPIIKPHGRLVNLGSMAGHIGKYSKPLQKQFLDAAASGSHDKVTAIMEGFKKSVASGTEDKDGWTKAAYAASKAGVIAMTAAIAGEAKKAGSTVLINSCCPGWVVTDMTKGRGYKNVDEGAQTPVKLGIEDIKVSGEFWQHEKVIEW